MRVYEKVCKKQVGWCVGLGRKAWRIFLLWMIKWEGSFFMIFILTKKCVIENNSFVGYSNSSQRQLTEERRIYLKNYKSTIILALILMFLSIVSLFIGVLEVSPKALFSEDMETIKIFFISRLPRLLAILCTYIYARFNAVGTYSICLHICSNRNMDFCGIYSEHSVQGCSYGAFGRNNVWKCDNRADKFSCV